MPKLTLTGAIPGLLRRGSPVSVDYGVLGMIAGVYTMPDDRAPNMRHGPHQVAPMEEWPEHDAGAAMARSCADEETTLDLTDPTGRFHALLWLRERGHDLRWAEDEPEVLAWSVLSVARGGVVIEAIGDVPRFVNTTVCVMTWFGATLWWAATEANRDHYTDPFGGHSGWGWLGESGQETGDDALRAICAAALRARYALRNADGSLTLPELPAVTP